MANSTAVTTCKQLVDTMDLAQLSAIQYHIQKRKYPIVAGKLFNVTELVENILVNVEDVRDIFLAMRVNRKFRDGVRSSAHILRRLFLIPEPSLVISELGFPLLNPLLDDVLHSLGFELKWLRDGNDHVDLQLEFEREVHYATKESPAELQRLEDKATTGTWRLTAITNFPMDVLVILANDKCGKNAIPSKPSFELTAEQATIGRLWDVAMAVRKDSLRKAALWMHKWRAFEADLAAGADAPR